MSIHLLPLRGIPLIHAGDDLGGLLAAAIEESRYGLRSGDVLVVCQKVVSKAEGRIIALSSVEPSLLACEWARSIDKDPRLIELVLRESRRIVRMEAGALIVETPGGYVCANAGIDQSNASAEDTVTLLPLDCDDSAERIALGVSRRLGLLPAVVVTDTFGRPWREGQIEFALGVFGFEPVTDLRGTKDFTGRDLGVTQIALADEIAAAAGLLMDKSAAVPAVLVRGLDLAVDPARRTGGRALIRPRERDLFR